MKPEGHLVRDKSPLPILIEHGGGTKASSYPVNDSSGVMSAMNGNLVPQIKVQKPRILNPYEQFEETEGLEKQLMVRNKTVLI